MAATSTLSLASDVLWGGGRLREFSVQKEVKLRGDFQTKNRVKLGKFPKWRGGGLGFYLVSPTLRLGNGFIRRIGGGPDLRKPYQVMKLS